MRLICLLGVGSLLAHAPACAEPALDLSGNVRVRYEAIDNQPRAGFGRQDDLLNIRTILGASYRGEGWRLGAELYDSRAYFGDAATPITTNEVNALELVSAWIATDIAAPFGPGSKATLKLGRDLLNLGSRRLVAADDYRNTTSSYTGLRTDLTLPDGVSAVAIYTLPQARLPDDRPSLVANRVVMDREGFDLVLWGGQIGKTQAIGAATLEASFYHLGERDAAGRVTRDRSLNTFGLRLLKEPKRGQIDYEGEVFVQRGRARPTASLTASRKRVEAWFGHLTLGYTLPDRWATRAAIEADYASGDRGGASYGRFDTLFGMRRAELAPAGLYNAVGRANVFMPGYRVSTRPSPRLDAFVAYRALWLASKTDSFSTTGVRDASGRSGAFAGHQVEGRVRWWALPKRLQLEVNALVLGKGRFLREAPNAPAGGNTRYVSFNATTFF